MNCNSDGNIPCPGYLMFFIEHDFKHNSISLDEVRFILHAYFGIKMRSLIPRFVHSVIECSDFDVVETYNHLKNCKYQHNMTEPIPGDYLVTPTTDYADTLADYVACLTKFIKQIRPRNSYNPRRRDQFTRRRFDDNL